VRFVFLGAAGCALVVVVAGFLDGFTVSTTVAVGADPDQRVTVYGETHSLLGYAHWRYLIVLAATLAALGVALWASWHDGGARSLAVLLGIALLGICLMAGQFDDRSVQCGDPCGGVFLGPAVDDLLADADTYSAQREIGWTLTTSAFYVLMALSGIALGRARPDLIKTLAPVAGVIAVALVAGVPSADCDDVPEHDPATNPFALLGLFLPLSASATGLGALLRRRWVAGAATLLLGVGLALVLVFVVLGKDCAFS
jgi:hypothetical protein